VVAVPSTRLSGKLPPTNPLPHRLPLHPNPNPSPFYSFQAKTRRRLRSHQQGRQVNYFSPPLRSHPPLPPSSLPCHPLPSTPSTSLHSLLLLLLSVYLNAPEDGSWSAGWQRVHAKSSVTVCGVCVCGDMHPRHTRGVSQVHGQGSLILAIVEEAHHRLRGWLHLRGARGAQVAGRTSLPTLPTLTLLPVKKVLARTVLFTQVRLPAALRGLRGIP